MLEIKRTADLLSVDDKPSSNALVREAQLIWKGVSSTPDYLRTSFDADHRAQTAHTALISAGLTLALSCVKRSPSLSWTVGRVAGPALAVPVLTDLSARAGVMKEAMADTWSSSKNWNQNVRIARESMGQFTADFAISAFASGLAEKFGRSYFAAKTPGVNALPELNKEGVLANWQKHMDGEIVPYKMLSPEGGGMRQVDLFIPPNLRLASESSSGSRSNLLIAQDGLKLDHGRLKNLELPDAGLINLRADETIDYIAAFTHPKRFRVVPGLNMAAWRHESGLIKEGGWFAPKTGNIDSAYIMDVERTLTSMFKTDRTVLAGYSSGAMLSNEVAAKLGPERIRGVISVASTVTGKEPPAVPGQFRLIVRDNGDPTLLQSGGAGGKAKLLARLGHRDVMQSMPERQIDYALSPYKPQTLGHSLETMMSNNYEISPLASIRHFALADGTPILAHIKTNHGKHAWMTAEETKINGNKKAESALPSHLQDHLDLNLLVKEIVNGNLQRFSVPVS